MCLVLVLLFITLLFLVNHLDSEESDHTHLLFEAWKLHSFVK